MYIVYVLKNTTTGKLYYGYTNKLERRLKEHKPEGMWKLVYYEAYACEMDARKREQKLKDYGQSRSHLKKRTRHSLQV